MIYMFPAGAGMNRVVESYRVVRCHVPRRRGDEPAVVKAEVMPEVCSPQARG